MTLSSSHRAALRELVERLAGTDAVWALTGSTSFSIQGMSVDAHDIDLQSDRAGVYAVERAFAGEVTRPVAFSATERIRSHFGALLIHGVKVELMGDIEKRLASGEWDRPPDLRGFRVMVEFDGLSIPVVPLGYESRAYKLLGRAERAREIEAFLACRG